MTEAAERYAFPHTGADEDRRLDLFAERLDPLTMRRIGGLGLAPDARCLEIGGGRGSIARWLCEQAVPQGQVTATDLETGFLDRLALPMGVPGTAWPASLGVERAMGYAQPSLGDAIVGEPVVSIEEDLLARGVELAKQDEEV